MSNFLDGYSSTNRMGDELQAWYDVVSKNYPLLASALLGNELTRKDEPLRPPFSLIISTKDGKLRFSLSSQEASKTYFGKIDDPAAILESCEACLRDQAGEWSLKRENGHSKGRW